MQKVVFTVSKVNREEKQKGIRYLVEGNLLIPSVSSKGNAYIRVFEDVADKCKEIQNSEKLTHTFNTFFIFILVY